MKQTLIILLLNYLYIWNTAVFSQDKAVDSLLLVGNCISAIKDGDKVVFTCENKLKVSLKVLGNGLLQVYYNMGTSKQIKKSFTVIETLNSAKETFNFSEQSDKYEIYTGQLIVRINKSPFQIRIFDKWQKLLMEDFKDRGFVVDSQKIACCKTLRPQERIYGLGEKNGPINRVGDRFKMWNSDKPCYQIHEDPLYKSIPFFLSSMGYGIFFDNTYKTEFNFGEGSENAYSFSAPGGEMIYYFIYGPTQKQIISRYVKLTGQAIMPPAWALGSQLGKSCQNQ